MKHPSSGGHAGPGRGVAVDLAETTELDVQTADTLGELADALRAASIELRLVHVRAPALDLLHRAGVAERATVETTLDRATSWRP